MNGATMGALGGVWERFGGDLGDLLQSAADAGTGIDERRDRDGDAET